MTNARCAERGLRIDGEFSSEIGAAEISRAVGRGAGQREDVGMKRAQLSGQRFGVEGRSWAAYLGGENLTNEKGAIDVIQAGFTGAARLRPRTVSLNLRYKYQ